MKKKYKKFYLTTIVSIVGVIGGYLYWKYIGCNSGSCAITSNWYTTALTGGLLGYLVSDSVNDLLQKKNK